MEIEGKSIQDLESLVAQKTFEIEHLEILVGEHKEARDQAQQELQIAREREDQAWSLYEQAQQKAEAAENEVKRLMNAAPVHQVTKQPPHSTPISDLDVTPEKVTSLSIASDTEILHKKYETNARDRDNVTDSTEIRKQLNALQNTIANSQYPKLKINRDYKLTKKGDFNVWLNRLRSETKSCGLLDVIEDSHTDVTDTMNEITIQIRIDNVRDLIINRLDDYYKKKKKKKIKDPKNIIKE